MSMHRRTDEQMASRVAEVAGSMSGAYALVQGTPVTSFARVLDGVLDFPPAVWPSGKPLPFTLLFEVRIFNQQQEWRAWRHPDGYWMERTLDEKALPEGLTPLEQQTEVLWGTRVGKQSDEDWICCTENRGTSVFVPRQAVAGSPDVLPFALRVQEYASFHNQTHLAMIADKRILGFALNQEIKEAK
jgi:CRISPR-associated protein (TIGR03984 family)